MNLHRKLIYTSLILVVVGLIGLIPYVWMWSDRQAALATPSLSITPQPLVTTASLVTGKPVRLNVPSLQLDLAVVDGAYDQATGQWTLSSDSAHFALPSITPNNETGNTLIYGHYRPEVFARLKQVTPGSQAIITTDNGYKFVYTFTATEAVAPTDTDIFAYQGAPQLTIQTCSGAWMQNRQLYYFAYTGYEAL